MAVAPPSLLIVELQLLNKNDTRHKGVQVVHRRQIKVHEEQDENTTPYTS